MEQQQIQELYKIALKHLVDDRYDNALESFNKVRAMAPNFPFIKDNVEQCQRLRSAYFQYVQAIDLMNQRNFQQAVYHLEYIECHLQKDYKNCLILIKACQDQLGNQNANRFTNEQQINQQRQFIIEFHQAIENAYVQYSNNPLQTQVPPTQVTQHQINQSEADEGRPLITENPGDQINQNKIAIYYKCTKTPVCGNNNEPFKHSQCKTTAYLNPDGQISCQQQNCQKFFIKDALFHCQTLEILNKNEQQQSGELEALTNIPMLADFVVNCLEKNNVPQTEQQKFRELFPSLVLPEMTNRGFL